MISIGISVHVVVGIHGAGPYHRTPKGIHGNVRGLVGWDSMVPRVSIAGLLRHGTTKVVHHLRAACVAVGHTPSSANVRLASRGSPAASSGVGIATDAGGSPAGGNRSRDRRRRGAAAHGPATWCGNHRPTSWIGGRWRREGSPASRRRRGGRRAPAAARARPAAAAATSPAASTTTGRENTRLSRLGGKFALGLSRRSLEPPHSVTGVGCFVVGRRWVVTCLIAEVVADA
mmetsp:Transcript_98733/g.235266  ORF Transcript_98733/g.235266 Transcript_98733/m.235266 type:complete len:231 (-) Transcript_98733:1469-2161(-)